MSDLSSKQVLSDTWNTVFIKMDAISKMGRGGQPVYQLSMIVLADRVEVGLMLCCHLSIHQICSDALNCSLGSAVDVLLLHTSALPLQGTCRCPGLNCCLIPQIDSQSFWIPRCFPSSSAGRCLTSCLMLLSISSFCSRALLALETQCLRCCLV